MAVTSKEEDVAHLMILVMREKEIVMDRVMEGNMMVMKVAKMTLFVEATTV